MNRLTSLFLILLQLAIGWHFLYEGWWKITQKQKPWSSKEYIHHAQGPFALPIRWTAGDPDVTRQGLQFAAVDPTQEFLAQFAVTPFDSTEPAQNRKPHLHMPPVLAKEWDDYFQRFKDHYHLEGPQLDTAQRDFIASEDETVKWLVSGSKKVKRSNLSGPAAEIPETTPQRIQEYQDKLQEVRALEAGEQGMFGSKVSAKVRKVHDEANNLKRSLQEDLDDQTDAMKAKLRSLLTYEQKRMGPVPAAAETKPAAWAWLPRIDWVVKWGLFAAGAGLLLGLFTRLACLVGSLFLIAFYLAMPPWPGLVEGAAVKGHYFIINENIIETLALLTIAVSRPGSRYGLDAWIGLMLRPFRRKRRPDWRETERMNRSRAREALVR
jgi:uncharacterized membrane protein YphA (DoxX/SURF4 family)